MAEDRRAAAAAAAAAAVRAPVATGMVEAVAAEMDLGRVATRVEAASVALAGHSVTNTEVGVVEEARAVEARAAVAVAVAVAGAEVKEAAA